MKSLYRRYRPLRLDDVVGQEQVTKPLSGSLKNGKISHAYLFIGPRGCGKTSVARILAHEINGFEYKLEDNYIDIIEIDGASNRGIDNIRELRDKVAISPSVGKYKVYIIDEVHMLTKEAFNALLKTLEEPPAHAVFIMATTDAYKVPVTITSRAQTYTFKLADHQTMVNLLTKIVEKEKIKIDNDAIDIIARRGGGSFRDSLSLLDQISLLSSELITKDMVVKVLGLPQDVQIANLLNAYLNQDLKTTTDTLKLLLSEGIKAEILVDELITKIIADCDANLFGLMKELTDVKPPHIEVKLLVALSNNTSYMASTPNVPKSITKPDIKPSTKKPMDVPNPSKLPGTLATSAKGDFSWNGFLEKVASTSDTLYSQLQKVDFEINGMILHIYPKKRIIKNILSSDNNKKILNAAAGAQVKITIHDENDTPNNSTNDGLISKISDIMGGEVENDEGGNPF